MEEFELIDALTGDTVIQQAGTGELFIRHSEDKPPQCTSLFFPGCSMINYAMPLVTAVYGTLTEQGKVDGISLLCCGKILSYEEGGDVLRASFEEQLREHVAAASVKRIVCACPNCLLAMRTAFADDPRTADIELVALPRILADIGYRIDARVAARIVRGDEEASVLLCPHDSCPDRDTGEYAAGLRDMLPEGLWADPEHCFNRSVCCGSLPRAAGKHAAADKCADINGREALDVCADAIVTACMSCAFQLNMAQTHLPALHFLELLYEWPIAWRTIGPWMKIRFLFDEMLGATELTEGTERTFAGLGTPDPASDMEVSISEAETEEIGL